ncbi:MAG: hypothetical protein IH949_01375 [Bacteroidetes bacterium]|nr:hypothetical protein [Bacteroidota bacterium]
MKKKSLQAIDNKNLKGSYTPIKVTNLKNARRLLSRLIYQLQTGEVANQTAKDLTYLLISYVNVFKAYEFEQRLIKLEEKLSI